MKPIGFAAVGAVPAAIVAGGGGAALRRPNFWMA